MMIKFVLKCIAMPLLLLTVLAQWIGTFFTGFASAILGMLSSLCWIIAILGYLMGICTGRETVGYLIAAFVAFIIPECCCWLIERIMRFRLFLGQIIRS